MDDKMTDADAIRAWLDENEVDDGVHPVRASALKMVRVMLEYAERVAYHPCNILDCPCCNTHGTRGRSALLDVRRIVEGR